MTNVIQFKPRKRPYRRLRHIDVHKEGRAYVHTHQQLMGEVWPTWWQRFRSNIKKLLGVHAMPRRDVAPSSDTHSVGGAA